MLHFSSKKSIILALSLMTTMTCLASFGQVQASWIMRTLNTPKELLGSIIGLDARGKAQNPINISSVFDLLPKQKTETKTPPSARLAYIPRPLGDMELSVASDYHAWSYTQPDSSLVSRSPTDNIKLLVNLKLGESFGSLLKGLGLSSKDRLSALAAIGARYKVEKFKPGTKFNVMLNARVMPGDDGRLAHLSSKPDALTTLSLELRDNGHFEAATTSKKLKDIHILATAEVIRESVFLDGKAVNIPDRILANLIRAYRHSMNIERTLKKGDSFSVLFEATIDPDNNIVKSGELLYTSIILDGEERSLYWFEHKSRPGFYYPSGRSQKRGSKMLRKPLRKGRVSSKFGMRMHPVLKRRLMHTGVDYAAPTGTPVYAAADGKIIYRRRKGGYGNHVEIKHSKTYTTTYSHLHRFARKQKVGSQVSRGQVIGYVGSTGRSTGPHLHYEIKRNGKYINPLTTKLTRSLDLQGSLRREYYKQRDKIRGIRKKATSNKQVKLR